METPRPRVRGGLAEITEQVLAELVQNRVPTPAYGVALCGRPLWNGDHGYTQDMVPRLQPACLSSEDGRGCLVGPYAPGRLSRFCGFSCSSNGTDPT